MEQIGNLGIEIYTLPDSDEDEDDDYKEQCRQLKVRMHFSQSTLRVHYTYISYSQAAVPFAVVGANQVIEIRGRKVRGRMYPWGVVEVENPEHSDFIKLRTMLMYE